MIDWISMIGHDPAHAKYPTMWQSYLPEYLRGRYDSPGWTGNGMAPWGLQPDPVGADGNNFFRAFFNLLLSFYGYVSGDDKWASPFKVTGYQDRLFDWDHHSIVSFMVDQWAERPAGVHCENTKDILAVLCVSGAVLGSSCTTSCTARTPTTPVRPLGRVRPPAYYMKTDKRGRMTSFTPPTTAAAGPDREGRGLSPSVTRFPPTPPCASPPTCTRRTASSANCLLATRALDVRTLGWDDPKKPACCSCRIPIPRWLAIGILMACR